MSQFAVIENNKVVNIIIADSKSVAEEITGLLCVEYSDYNPAYLGLGFNDGVFEQPVTENTTE
jgi:hypothetical protein